MKIHTISSNIYPTVRLKSIEEKDIEELRVWKNKNKINFFSQKEISSEMQRKWFKKYISDKNGYIYVVEEYVDSNYFHSIGCLGYRDLGNDGIDLYNIIRGKKSLAGQTMISAMQLLLNALWKNYDSISCKVLKTNPSIKWYIHVGFEQIEDNGSYVLMAPNSTKIPTFDVDIKEIKRQEVIK